MKYDYLSRFFYVFILISKLNACVIFPLHVHECYPPMEEEDRELDPVKYCVDSRLYFECIHETYGGCEEKEEYRMSIKFILEDLSKRVDELRIFCSDKIEDFEVDIVCEFSDSVRNDSSHSPGVSSKNSILSSPTALSPVSNDLCQVEIITDLCKLPMMNDESTPLWNSTNKRSRCQQARSFLRCIKRRLDKCSQQDIPNEFEHLINHLHLQINTNCPFFPTKCPEELRFNTSSSTFCLAYFFLQTALQILLFF